MYFIFYVYISLFFDPNLHKNKKLSNFKGYQDIIPREIEKSQVSGVITITIFVFTLEYKRIKVRNCKMNLVNDWNVECKML